MDRVFFSVTEMEQIAARIGLPLDDATREATRATVEGWLNDANDLREEMEKRWNQWAWRCRSSCGLRNGFRRLAKR